MEFLLNVGQSTWRWTEAHLGHLPASTRCTKADGAEDLLFQGNGQAAWWFRCSSRCRQPQGLTVGEW